MNAAMKTSKGTPKAKGKSKAPKVKVAPSKRLTDHFESVRESLVSLYKLSKSASHATVQGTLREGFVRSAVSGHLGETLAWSSGQIVTRASSNWLSGQLDLVIHRSDSPQIYLQESFVRLIPSEAVLAVLEVKSDLTTGDMSLGMSSVLLQSLDTVCDARRAAADLEPVPTMTSLKGKPPAATFIVAFRSGQTAETVVQKTSEYISKRKLSGTDFWPTAILVLSGGKKHKNGFAIIRDADPRFGGTVPRAKLPTGVACSVVETSSLAAFLSVLSKATQAHVPLLEYVFG